MAQKNGFDRNLPPKLIDQLNELAAQKGSWWHSLIRKDDTFFAIRPGYLSLYTKGGSLLKVELGSKGQLRCMVHEEYLFLRNTRPYVDINKSSQHEFRFIKNGQELVKNYLAVQRRIRKFQGEERHGVGLIASKISNVIDIEVTDQQPVKETPTSDKNKKKSRKGSIDLAAVSDGNEIWFFEAKLLTNQELSSQKGKPPIVKQIEQYGEWIKKKEDKIVTVFNKARDIYGQLQGPFFQKRSKTISKITGVRTRPVLLIFGFNEIQRRKKLPTVLKELRDHGMKADIVTIGNPHSLTAKRLFKPNG